MLTLSFYLLILTQLSCISSGTIKFTNARCDNFDNSSIVIKKCILKALGRNKVALNLHIGLLKVPVDHITAQAQLLRKSHDYRPYLYGTNLSICKAVAMKPTQAFDFWQMVYNTFRSYTNVNHTCPYNHDFIVKDFILDLNSGIFQILPFPADAYQVRYDIYFRKSFKFRITLNIDIKEF